MNSGAWTARYALSGAFSIQLVGRQVVQLVPLREAVVSHAELNLPRFPPMPQAPRGVAAPGPHFHSSAW